jgi:hypothetical protein
MHVVEAAAAWAARGAEVAGGRQRRREVLDGDRATAVSPRARGRTLAGARDHGPSWAASKRALPLNFSKISKQAQNL